MNKCSENVQHDSICHDHFGNCLACEIKRLRTALEWIYGTYANSEWRKPDAAEQNYHNLLRTIREAKDALKLE